MLPYKSVVFEKYVYWTDNKSTRGVHIAAKTSLSL